jgi:hypothetical protein
MKLRTLLLAITVLLARTFAVAAGIDAALQAKIDEQIKQFATWAADPVIVDAVKAHNASIPADQLSLTQEKWRELTVLDPQIRAFSKNPVGQLLKAKKSDVITEAFVSDAAGLKVGFIAKTSNWSHKGKPKHDVPMTGKTWQGAIEIDESSGQQQLQVAVPVLDGSQAIGSLVVGLSLNKLSQ